MNKVIDMKGIFYSSSENLENEIKSILRFKK